MHRNANERGDTTTKSGWLLRVSRGVGSSHLSRLPYGARSTLTPSITLDAPLCRRVARGNPPATSSGDSSPDAGLGILLKGIEANAVDAGRFGEDPP